MKRYAKEACRALDAAEAAVDGAQALPQDDCSPPQVGASHDAHAVYVLMIHGKTLPCSDGCSAVCRPSSMEKGMHQITARPALAAQLSYLTRPAHAMLFMLFFVWLLQHSDSQNGA